MAVLVKPLVKQSATLAVLLLHTTCVEKKRRDRKKSELVRRLIAEKCLSVRLFSVAAARVWTERSAALQQWNSITSSSNSSSSSSRSAKKRTWMACWERSLSRPAQPSSVEIEAANWSDKKLFREIPVSFFFVLYIGQDPLGTNDTMRSILHSL